MSSGAFWGDIGEWLGIQNQHSHAGKERLEAEKNRQFQATQAKQAMDFESDQAQINRDFQMHMSNTAHQRAVADLQSAGLNPVLAAGSQASTPGGSTASGKMASGSKADVSNIKNPVMDLIDTASTAVKTMTGQANKQRRFDNTIKLLGVLG